MLVMFFNPCLCSILHRKRSSQTELLWKSVDWFLYIRQTLQSKDLIKTAIISTHLQLAHVHLITCQFLMILALKHFVFGLILIESTI